MNNRAMNLDVNSSWSVDGYAGPEGLTRSQRAPLSPGANELVVEVEAMGLNPLDLKLLSGSLQQFMPVTFPFVPGSDFCGHVLRVGTDVVDYSPGDRVVGMMPSHRAMSQQVICSPGAALFNAPAHLDATDLAALPEVGLTAMAILRAAGPLAGKTIAIIGAAGGIGLILCQLASAAGALVVATGTGDDETLLRKNGAEEVIDYHNRSTIEALQHRQPGRPTVLIDLVNEGDELLSSGRSLAPGGLLVSTLMGPPPEQFDGINVSYIRLSPAPGDLERLIELLGSRALKANVTQVFDYAEVPQAYLALRDNHVRGKVVVRVK